MKSARLSWLTLALVATAALAAFGEASEPPAVRPVATFDSLPNIRALATRSALPAGTGNPFSSAVPAAVATSATTTIIQPAAVPPAPTLSPDLPWRVIGKQLDEHEGWAVFLARGEETWIVRAGDTLDGNYRVAAIQPPTLTLQHLKNRSRRTLDIGEVKE